MKPRQQVRRACIVTSFVLTPVTLYYFSPVLSLQGAAEGIITGSMIVFALLFLAALFLGRAFCGWACPMGGFQELIAIKRGKVVDHMRLRWVKFVIWAPWLLLLVYVLLQAGGVKSVQPFFMTTHGVSVADSAGAIALVSVVLLFALPALIFGRRASCHTICWIAPFMIAGRSVRNLLGWPSLRLTARGESCTGCGACARKCPMSIDPSPVREGAVLESADCILCFSCVDACPRGAIRAAFSSGRL